MAFLTILIISSSFTNRTLATESISNSQQLIVPERLNSHYFEISEELKNMVLDDKENRITPLFQVPTGIRSIVEFWFKIYSQYSLLHTVIYDKDFPEIVFDVIDSRDLFNKGANAVVIEVTTKSRTSSYLKKLNTAFDRLSKNPIKKFPSDSIESKLVKLYGFKKSKDWKLAKSRIRTQKGQRDKILQGLINAENFWPSMEYIFSKIGVPVEVTRLPLVESSFTLSAKSKVAAVGVWQFMEKSAHEYLVVDYKNNIDERVSPIKSTLAAAKMFKRNYSILKDWGLSVIAYNHGAKNLIPIHKKFGGENIAKLLTTKSGSPLGYASNNFYAEFLAALHCEKYKEFLYGIKQNKVSIQDISIVRLKNPASVYEISAQYNLSLHELKRLNPDVFDLKKKLKIGTKLVLPLKLSESLVKIEKSKNRSVASNSDFDFLTFDQE